MVRKFANRTSRKQVEELCNLFGMRFVKHQRLGNRKDYYYEYSIIESNGNKVADSESLKAAYYKLIDRCHEIVAERKGGQEG